MGFYVIIFHETAAHFAAKDNQVEALKYFYDLSKKKLKLYNSVILIFFFNFDFSIFEMENSAKLRPIHYAGSNGAVDAFKFLFSIDELDKRSLANTGKNALHLACLNGHDKIVEFLLNEPNGFDVFDVNEGDNYGETPLHLASTNRHKNVVSLLLNVKGIVVNKKNLKGETPLDLARERNENPVIEILENKYKELNLL